MDKTAPRGKTTWREIEQGGKKDLRWNWKIYQESRRGTYLTFVSDASKKREANCKEIRAISKIHTHTYTHQKSSNSKAIRLNSKYMFSILRNCQNVLFVSLFLASLGLHCCSRAFSCCGHGSRLRRSGCRARLGGADTRARLLLSTWSLPGPGMEPASSVLAGTVLSTAPPQKSLTNTF